MAVVEEVPQHMRALASANRVRLARAELKRRVADGATAVADVIADCPWEAETMTVFDVLMAQHRWGRTRARRFLAGFAMGETKTVGALTDRQRKNVVARLRGEAIADPFTDPFRWPL